MALKLTDQLFWQPHRIVAVPLKICLGLSILCSALVSNAQDDFIIKANREVDGHQNRIDQYDGLLDGKVTLLSEQQTSTATKLYQFKVNQVQKNINNDLNLKPLEKKRLLIDLANMLEKVDRGNYFLYNAGDIYFDMILKIQEIAENNRVISILKSDVVTGLNVIPFFDYKPYATEVLKHMARIQPSQLLSRFGDFAYQSYSADILEELCKFAPMHVSFYMGQNNAVFTVMNAAKNKPQIELMLSVFNKVGSNSRAYLLLDDIGSYKVTTQEAHELGRDREALFKYLMKLRAKPSINGSFSVDDELTYSSLQWVRAINELHDEGDAIRFRVCDSVPFTAEELYTLMVYGEDEIYTSTFLGLFKRLMARMQHKSSYEFLHAMGMNRYRTFIKMAAGYNTLPEFLSKMSEWEKRALFNKLVAGLTSELNPLEQAVAVADTYGSLKNSDDREILALALTKEYQQIRWSSREAEKLYGMLMAVLGLQEGVELITEEVKTSATLTNASLFKNNEHIQQHFFFDDEDGVVSYNTFLERFNRTGWELIDNGTFVVIQSEGGKKVLIYANKPEFEFDGQKAIRALFTAKGRFPDVVVHRGHSYYASATIQTLTPNADLVILGSCGGYNNIISVLNYSPKAQIISSKQVGTYVVNNELVFSVCETIRNGQDLKWELLWAGIERVIGKNTVSADRFNDYLPPHKNLGALLIRNYRNAL